MNGFRGSMFLALPLDLKIHATQQMKRFGFYIMLAGVYAMVAWIAIELVVDQFRIVRKNRPQAGQEKRIEAGSEAPKSSDDDPSHGGPLAAA